MLLFTTTTLSALLAIFLFLRLCVAFRVATAAEYDRTTREGVTGGISQVTFADFRLTIGHLLSYMLLCRYIPPLLLLCFAVLGE